MVRFSAMEKILYQGKIVEVVHFDVTQAGKKMVFEKARRSPGVRLIIPGDNTILISKEDRQEVGGYDYRLPGGKVFDTLEEYNQALASGSDMTEAAKKAAIKEAREEVHIDVQDLSFFHRSICGTTMEWDLYFFVVNKYEAVDRALVEAERTVEKAEDIEATFTDLEKVRAMCLDGSMSEERSALVLLRYLSQ